MSGRPHRLSGTVITAMPAAAFAARAAGSSDRATMTRPGFTSAAGKPWSRRAAAHLQIDEAVAHAVQPHDLADDEPQRRFPDRLGQPNGRERAREPREMALFLDQPAAADLADLIDAVAEGEGAVVDRNPRLRAPDIAAVDISDARHAPFPAWAEALPPNALQRPHASAQPWTAEGPTRITPRRATSACGATRTAPCR